MKKAACILLLFGILSAPGHGSALSSSTGMPLDDFSDLEIHYGRVGLTHSCPTSFTITGCGIYGLACFRCCRFVTESAYEICWENCSGQEYWDCSLAADDAWETCHAGCQPG